MYELINANPILAGIVAFVIFLMVILAFNREDNDPNPPNYGI
jgi:hypothetical protein